MDTERSWAIPADISADGRRAAEAIRDFLVEKGLDYHGGGGAFYSPQQWRDRREQYGLNSLLIITHDGGDHAHAFNYDYEGYELIEELRQRLALVGMYAEQCTSWYSSVHRV